VKDQGGIFILPVPGNEKGIHPCPGIGGIYESDIIIQIFFILVEDNQIIYQQ